MPVPSTSACMQSVSSSMVAGKVHQASAAPLAAATCPDPPELVEQCRACRSPPSSCVFQRASLAASLAALRHQALQVSDEGGGIPRSGLSKIWTYLYSTAHSPLEEMARDGGDGADGPAVLAGYGYGLPISRLYARYFGGDLQVIPFS